MHPTTTTQPRLSSRLLRSFLILALSVLTTAPVSAAQYTAEWGWFHDNPGVPPDGSQTTNSCFASVSNFCNHPCNQGACNQNANAQFLALATNRVLGLASYYLPWGHASGSCSAGGYTRAEKRFDVTFTCPGMSGASIPVQLNFQVEGEVWIANPGGSGVSSHRLNVHAGPSPGNTDCGTWLAQASSPFGANTGVFTSVPPTNHLSGTFSGPSNSVLLDGSGNATGNFVLAAKLWSFGEATRQNADVSFYPNYNSLRFPADPNRGIRLPASGPVFNLPAGCTCNSTEVGIVNNLLAANPCDPVPVTKQSWGRIKASYR